MPGWLISRQANDGAYLAGASTTTESSCALDASSPDFVCLLVRLAATRTRIYDRVRSMHVCNTRERAGTERYRQTETKLEEESCEDKEYIDD